MKKIFSEYWEQISIALVFLLLLALGFHMLKAIIFTLCYMIGLIVYGAYEYGKQVHEDDKQFEKDWIAIRGQGTYKDLLPGGKWYEENIASKTKSENKPATFGAWHDHIIKHSKKRGGDEV